MNDCIKSIYIFWVGLSGRHKAHDIRGLPIPIPIIEMGNDLIVVDKQYFVFNKIPLPKIGQTMREVAETYRTKNQIRLVLDGLKRLIQEEKSDYHNEY